MPPSRPPGPAMAGSPPEPAQKVPRRRNRVPKRQLVVPESTLAAMAALTCAVGSARNGDEGTDVAPAERVATG